MTDPYSTAELSIEELPDGGYYVTAVASRTGERWHVAARSIADAVGAAVEASCVGEFTRFPEPLIAAAHDGYHEGSRHGRDVAITEYKRQVLHRVVELVLDRVEGLSDHVSFDTIVDPRSGRPFTVLSTFEKETDDVLVAIFGTHPNDLRRWSIARACDNRGVEVERLWCITRRDPSATTEAALILSEWMEGSL